MGVTTLLATIAATASIWPAAAVAAPLFGPSQHAASRPGGGADMWPHAVPPAAEPLIRRRREFGTRHYEAGSATRRITLDFNRSRRPPKHEDPDMSSPVRRLSTWQASAAYELTPHVGGTIRLEAAMSMDRRKPWIAVGGGHWLGSKTEMITLRWQADRRLRIEGGWRGVTTSRTLANQARVVLLAAGAPIAEHGLQMSVLLLPSDAPDRGLRLGASLAAMSVDHRDAFALGARNDRDRRATLSIGFRFR